MVEKDDAHGIQVGQDGDDEQGHSVDETDEDQPEETDKLFTSKLSISPIHVGPDLLMNFEFLGYHDRKVTLTMSFGLGANSIVVPFGCLPCSILATAWA